MKADYCFKNETKSIYENTISEIDKITIKIKILTYNNCRETQIIETAFDEKYVSTLNYV